MHWLIMKLTPSAYCVNVVNTTGDEALVSNSHNARTYSSCTNQTPARTSLLGFVHCVLLFGVLVRLCCELGVLHS